jgi:ferredoxin
LALPGAICDVEFEAQKTVNSDSTDALVEDQPLRGRLKTFVLDNEMLAQPGDTVDPTTGNLLETGVEKAVGITGTGVVALISQGLKAGIIRLPRDIETAYMSGASGTYVDALKAQEIGMIPSGAKKIYQVGNSSLAMARDMVRDVDELWRMKQIADELRQHHCMFADSKVFEKVYILELSYWTQGMPLSDYQKFLKKFGLPPLKEAGHIPEVIKTVKKDIPELGIKGLKIISDVGEHKTIVFEGCTGCAACIEECPENALRMEEDKGDASITIDLARCNGFACRRCEKACTEKVFVQKKLYAAKGERYTQLKVRCHG